MVQIVLVYCNRFIPHYHSPTLSPLKIHVIWDAGLIGQKKRRHSRPFLFFLCATFNCLNAWNKWKLLSSANTVILLSVVQKAAPVFDSLGEILLRVHSSESQWAVFSCGTVNHALGFSNFWVRGWNLTVWPFKWKLLSNTFLWYCLLCCTTWFST